VNTWRESAKRTDPVVERDGVESDEEHIEEIFGQLWSDPNPDNPRVEEAAPAGGRLVWIRKELMRDGKSGQKIVLQ
jgi:hypothetical protein